MEAAPGFAISQEAVSMMAATHTHWPSSVMAELSAYKFAFCVQGLVDIPCAVAWNPTKPELAVAALDGSVTAFQP